MEKEIFEMCTTRGMQVHKFTNNTRCIFYKGFKFEEVTDVNGDLSYNCYNVRYVNYKRLTNEEMRMLLDFGVIVSSDVLSFKNYKRLVEVSRLAINNPKNGYKVIEKSNKMAEHYEKLCNNLISLHKKHTELFV